MKKPQYNLSQNFYDKAVHLIAGATSGASQTLGIYVINNSSENLIPSIFVASFLATTAPPFVIKRQLEKFELQPYLLGILVFQLSTLTYLEVNSNHEKREVNQPKVQILSLK